MMLVLKNKSKGFVMPIVIFMIVVMSFIAYAALLQANNSLNLAYKHAYLQMARVASKAAIDYAQEQFDNAPCGAYTGTTETDLVSNDNYRVTFKSDVVSTSPDGYDKTINGTGSVYLPKLSTAARYVFDVRSEVVRTYALCKTPDNFAPLIWLDASDTTTLRKVTSPVLNSAPSTSYGAAGDSTRDTLEERADNGSQTAESWASNDFEMHSCDSSEFSNAICSSNTTKYTNIGLVFSGANVPKNSSIISASIKLACTTPSGQAGSLDSKIYGLYNSSTNPHRSPFTRTGSNQILSGLNTPSLRTSTSATVTSNNCPPGNNTVFDVTAIAQEMVNNTNWDPTNPTNGGRMAFGFTRTGGAGSRHFLKAGNALNISYSSSSLIQANNTESLGAWLDKSGNGNHALQTYGNAAARQDNQINGKTIVRFNNGTMLSSLTNILNNRREMSVIAVTKSKFSTSANDGRLVSGLSSSVNDDSITQKSIIPLYRHNTSSGFSNTYDGSSSSYRTNATCGSVCDEQPYLYSSHFELDQTDSVLSTLRGNGAILQTKENISPTTTTPPYSFSLDQFYFGGTRNGSGGSSYLNGDYAEIIVYAHKLQCREIEAIEEYLRAKWAISATQYTSTCPVETIPTL